MSAATTADDRTAPLTASTRAGEVVRRYIGEQLDVLHRALARTERNEPGSVALTRSAVHRIRAAILGYRHLFLQTPQGGPQFDQLLAAFKRTEDLEALRVHFQDRFDQLDLTVPEYPHWFGALHADERASYDQVERISDQAWVAGLLGQVRLFADRARLSEDGERPASSLIAVLSAARTHLLDTYARISHAVDPTVARDEARQTARHTHYLAEAALPALGRPVAELMAPVADLERLLTRYRQASIARGWLLRLRGDPLALRLTDLEREHLRQLGEQIDQAVTALIDRWN